MNPLKTVTTNKGEQLKMLTFNIKDSKGHIRVALWGDKATKSTITTHDTIATDNAEKQNYQHIPSANTQSWSTVSVCNRRYHINLVQLRITPWGKFCYYRIPSKTHSCHLHFTSTKHAIATLSIFIQYFLTVLFVHYIIFVSLNSLFFCSRFSMRTLTFR